MIKLTTKNKPVKLSKTTIDYLDRMNEKMALKVLSTPLVGKKTKFKFKKNEKNK